MTLESWWKGLGYFPKDGRGTSTRRWIDTYWGICNGRGENKLGKILMEIRDVLREQESML